MNDLQQGASVADSKQSLARRLFNIPQYELDRWIFAYLALLPVLVIYLVIRIIPILQSFWLSLTDLKMPRTSGRCLIESLRSNPRTSALPVILVTGAVPSIDDFPPDGSYDCLIMKPFDIWDVVDTVGRIAGRCGF